MNQEYLLQMHVYERITPHSGLDGHGGSPFISWSDLSARYNYCIFIYSDCNRYGYIYIFLASICSLNHYYIYLPISQEICSMIHYLERYLLTEATELNG